MARQTTEELTHSRANEYLVYVVMWSLAILLPVINEVLGLEHGSDFSWRMILKWWLGSIPFLAVFLLNTFVLVPRFLYRNKVIPYLASAFASMIAFVLFETFTYNVRMSLFHEVVSMDVKVFMGMPLPVLLYFSTVLLLMAVSTAVTLLFRLAREYEKRKSLENIRLQDELRFLKAQINPHFFMNMLNSIHGMIELDPDKAQEMTIEMSRLMRYVLYEGENQTTTLARESEFISSYVYLMRRRYPESKVSISLDLPENPSNDMILPPLLFVSFVENAFKHGVSYLKKSRICISLAERDGNVVFRCSNTKAPLPDGTTAQEGGVGLENVRRRLSLLYSDSYRLDIEDEEEIYNVNLIIPSL